MKEKRFESMKQYILDHNHVSLKELEDEFNVSMNTIRRDVNKILNDSRFEKVYGGVSVKEGTLVDFEYRNIENKEEKKEIAKQAATFIEPDDLIYIDSGTTTKYILDYIDENIPLIIITNSLDVVLKAEKLRKATIFLIGHIFKKPTRSFVGVENDELSVKYNITKAFMAATAVSIDNGLMNSDIMEYEIKRQVMDKANKKFLLADETKFDRSTLLTYAGLGDIDVLITNKQFTEPYTTYISEHDIHVLNV
ncbi:DeoR/GlpR family DNA-binding transcription regulator [Vagococcus sp. JNUCC 83]